MRRVLHFQADRIEMVLASHKVPARVTGGIVTPRLVRYHLTTPLGVRMRKVASLSEEIALSLGASSCRVHRHQGQVEVEVPRAKGKVVPLLPLCQRLVARGPDSIPPHTAVLGLDQEGVPLLLRLPSPNVAHVLIAGTTGSGKTALARTIVTSLALNNSQRSLQLVLIDPKGRGFLPFEGLPHLLVPVVTRVAEALSLLQRLVAEMERRDAEGRSEPRLVVALDELRIVGSVASPEDAKVATGIGGTGAERLLGQGDFLVVAKGQVTRMQAAYAGVGVVRELVGRLGAGSKPLLLAATGTDGRRNGNSSLTHKLSTLGSRLKLVK
jgi:S-DNA-T family DNA segregation ATPase FtsK/SpoIIIE